MPAPATSSRHLNTGHRQANTQVATWLRAHLWGRPLSRESSSIPGFGVIIESFRCVNSGSLSFVFSSHDTKVMDCAKRLLILKDGRISNGR